MAEKKTWKEIAEALWGILDDISTAGDIAKGDDKAYRRMVEKLQVKRCEHLMSRDGYTLERVDEIAPVLKMHAETTVPKAS
jgi:hypothetical protein